MKGTWLCSYCWFLLTLAVSAAAEALQVVLVATPDSLSLKLPAKVATALNRVSYELVRLDSCAMDELEQEFYHGTESQPSLPRFTRSLTSLFQRGLLLQDFGRVFAEHPELHFAARNTIAQAVELVSRLAPEDGSALLTDICLKLPLDRFVKFVDNTSSNNRWDTVLQDARNSASTHESLNILPSTNEWTNRVGLSPNVSKALDGIEVLEFWDLGHPLIRTHAIIDEYTLGISQQPSIVKVSNTLLRLAAEGEISDSEYMDWMNNRHTLLSKRALVMNTISVIGDVAGSKDLKELGNILETARAETPLLKFIEIEGLSREYWVAQVDTYKSRLRIVKDLSTGTSWDDSWITLELPEYIQSVGFNFKKYTLVRIYENTPLSTIYDEMKGGLNGQPRLSGLLMKIQSEARNGNILVKLWIKEALHSETLQMQLRLKTARAIEKALKSFPDDGYKLLSWMIANNGGLFACFNSLSWQEISSDEFWIKKADEFPAGVNHVASLNSSRKQVIALPAKPRRAAAKKNHVASLHSSRKQVIALPAKPRRAAAKKSQVSTMAKKPRGGETPFKGRQVTIMKDGTIQVQLPAYLFKTIGSKVYSFSDLDHSETTLVGIYEESQRGIRNEMGVEEFTDKLFKMRRNGRMTKEESNWWAYSMDVNLLLRKSIVSAIRKLSSNGVNPYDAIRIFEHSRWKKGIREFARERLTNFDPDFWKQMLELGLARPVEITEKHIMIPLYEPGISKSFGSNKMELDRIDNIEDMEELLNILISSRFTLTNFVSALRRACSHGSITFGTQQTIFKHPLFQLDLRSVLLLAYENLKKLSPGNEISIIKWHRRGKSFTEFSESLSRRIKEGSWKEMVSEWRLVEETKQQSLDQESMMREEILSPALPAHIPDPEASILAMDTMFSDNAAADSDIYQNFHDADGAEMNFHDSDIDIEEFLNQVLTPTRENEEDDSVAQILSLIGDQFPMVILTAFFLAALVACTPTLVDQSAELVEYILPAPLATEHNGGRYTFIKFGPATTARDILAEYTSGNNGQEPVSVISKSLRKQRADGNIADEDWVFWNVFLGCRARIFNYLKMIKDLGERKCVQVFGRAQGAEPLLEFSRQKKLQSKAFWTAQIHDYRLEKAKEDLSGRIKVLSTNVVILTLENSIKSIVGFPTVSFSIIHRDTTLKTIWDDTLAQVPGQVSILQFLSALSKAFKAGSLTKESFRAMFEHPLLRVDIRSKIRLMHTELHKIAPGSEFSIVDWMAGDMAPLEFFKSRSDIRSMTVPGRWKTIVKAYYVDLAERIKRGVGRASTSSKRRKIEQQTPAIEYEQQTTTFESEQQETAIESDQQTTAIESEQITPSVEFDQSSDITPANPMDYYTNPSDLSRELHAFMEDFPPISGHEDDQFLRDILLELGATPADFDIKKTLRTINLPPGLGAASYTLANLTDETEISVIYSEMHSGNYGQYKLSSLIKRLASLVKKGDVPKSDARAFGRSSSLILRKKVYRMVSMASDFLESTGEYTCQVLELLRNGAPLSEFVGAEMGRGKSDSYSRLSMAAHSIREFTVSVDVNGSLSERLGGVSSYRFWGLEEMTLNEVMREFQLGLFGQQSLRIFMNTLVKLVDLNLMTNIEHAMWFSDKRIRFQERRDIVTAVKTIKRLSKTSNHYQEIFLLGQGDKSLLEFAQDRADIRSDPFWNQQIEKFNLAAAQKDIASRVELNDRGQVVLNLQPCLATVLETRQFSFINVTRNTNLEALWNEMFENPD
ncbi:MAG: hypothetical protein SGCHY_001845, partial [Lobulomycetales sp.]